MPRTSLHLCNVASLLNPSLPLRWYLSPPQPTYITQQQQKPIVSQIYKAVSKPLPHLSTPRFSPNPLGPSFPRLTLKASSKIWPGTICSRTASQSAPPLPQLSQRPFSIHSTWPCCTAVVYLWFIFVNPATCVS